MTTTTRAGAVHRVAQSLAEVVRHARLSGADELEQAIGLRVDAAGAVILARLRPDSATRLGDLADRLGLAPSTVSRQLPPLEETGLVARRTDPDDKRVSLLHLTDAGRDAAERITAYQATRIATLMRDWPQHDIAAFADLLDRFVTELVNGHP